MANLKARHIIAEIRRALLDNYVIIVDGPHGLELESLALEVTRNKYHLLDFRNEELREIALKNPRAFVRSLPPYVIMKEVYLAPEVLFELGELVYYLRIKHEGFIQNAFIVIQHLDTEKIGFKSQMHSISYLTFHITPFYSAEIVPYGDINFLHNLFHQKHYPQIIKNNYDLRELMQRCTFPEILRKKSIDKDEFFKNIIRSAAGLFSDKPEEFNNISEALSILALNIGKLYNDNILPSKSQINEMQLFALSKKAAATGLYIPLEQWSPLHDKSEQHMIHLVDTELVLFARGETKIDDTNYNLLLRNFIVSEIYKQTKTYGTYKLYHFQLYKECPIDYVVENLMNNHIISISVEMNHHIGEDTIAKVKRFQNHCSSFLKKNVIIYLGDKVIKITPDIIALPIASLWYSGGIGQWPTS